LVIVRPECCRGPPPYGADRPIALTQKIIDESTVSRQITVSGYGYDLKTGRVEQLVAPRSRDGE
jgi:hypothetical protein